MRNKQEKGLQNLSHKFNARVKKTIKIILTKKTEPPPPL